MAPPLIIRNLTSSPISLNSIEKFEDPHSQQSKATAFPFASKNTTSLAPAAPKLGEHAQSFNHQDLNITLAPFQSYTLKSNAQASDAEGSSLNPANTTLRLSIESSGGERYRIDTNPTYTQKASNAFTPLNPNPSTSYAALYHPAKPTPHLTIHANHLHDLSKWMAAIPPRLPLSALSIPGTHNSHTHYRALPSVRCQVVSVKTQLENGIRFLDIRVQPAHATDTNKKDLYLVHGAFPVSLTGTKYLDPVLKTCYEFLEHNPSEAILISLKKEGTGNSTDEHLSQILEEHYIAPNKDKWHTGPDIPYLGDVRGKLVLVRRYALHETLQAAPDNHAYGLDGIEWPYNCTNATHGPFRVQDFCEVSHPSTITEKLQYSNEHLVRAAECTAFIPGVNTDETNPVPAGPLYLNFLSGSNFWKMGCWPDRIAKVVNRGMEEWICIGHHLEHPVSSPEDPSKDDGSTGVVVMDCVGEGGDWDLVKMIIGMNMGVLMKTVDGDAERS
ncbi:PLC-like phosphodiesterase [Clohesyomyces aquaticus]|uniref:PLC-like phosphodiesterase n=1 Tax=Clohesyomyces aquaticus TaxID=1231657 RepID=A0A1Y1ZFZ7_9PLEO|nr:PLC-like phosphodiesterase [Clohesyomyces aquaticus]